MKYKSIGSFRNEYGELYHVLKNTQGEYYITGDETDWKRLYWSENEQRLAADFVLNDLEKQQVIDVINKNK